MSKKQIMISIDAWFAGELKALDDQSGRKALPSASALVEKGRRSEVEKLRAEQNRGDPLKTD